MAYETPLTIAEAVKEISRNQYVLPSIQREYVWDMARIETLFDSLMRDYPIGTFLFWKIRKENVNDYDFYEFLKNYHEKNSVHNQKADLKGSDGVTAVLDGQQRLTSLYIGLKGTYSVKTKWKQKNNDNAYPERKLYLNLVSPANDGKNQYEFKFLTKEEAVNSSDAYWFEAGQILDMQDAGSIGKYMNRNIYKSGIEYTEEQTDFANSALYQLHKVIHTSLSISCYKEKSSKLDRVLNIFIRVNSGGAVLSYSDLLLSIASAQWDKYDAREEITRFVDEINSIGDGFKTDKDFVLKSALVLTDLSDIAFKVDNFNKQNMTKIESNWDNIKKAIRQAVYLVSSFGYSGETLSSNYALIPIAYYIFSIGMPNNFVQSSSTKSNRAKIKKWLIMSLLKRVFGNSPDSVLRTIREIIQQNGNNEFPLEKIIETFRGKNKSIVFTDDDIEELLKLQYSGKDTLSVLMMLYPSLDFSNKFHKDHIYPKSKFNKTYLRKTGVPENQIDTYIQNVNNIGNLQLLPALLNEEKLAEDFEIWFEQTCPTDMEKIQYRTIHYLPDMKYSYENFLTFLEKRNVLIRAKLKSLLM